MRVLCSACVCVCVRARARAAWFMHGCMHTPASIRMHRHIPTWPSFMTILNPAFECCAPTSAATSMRWPNSPCHTCHHFSHNDVKPCAHDRYRRQTSWKWPCVISCRWIWNHTGSFFCKYTQKTLFFVHVFCLNYLGMCFVTQLSFGFG